MRHCCEVRLGLVTCGGGVGKGFVSVRVTVLGWWRVWFRWYPSWWIAVCRVFSG